MLARTLTVLLLALVGLAAILVFFFVKFMAPAAMVSERMPQLAAATKAPTALSQPCRTVDVRDYRIRLYDSVRCRSSEFHDQPAFEILRDGRRVYVRIGRGFALGYPLAHNQPVDSVPVPPGTDITGDGIPDLLISEWSGGSHCCYTFHLFELGSTFRAIQSLPLFDDDEAAFVRRAGRKGLVLFTHDYSAFRNFPSGFAGSPAGRVLLSFQNGAFRLDAGLMRAPAPASGVISKCAKRFHDSGRWSDQDQPMGVWYYATDLLYSGNAAQAWDFLEQAWDASPAAYSSYVGEYRQRLEKSIYYGELRRLQDTPPGQDGPRVDWERHCFEYLNP